MKVSKYKPWEKLCIDLIGEYTIKCKGKNNYLKLKAMTMIDPVTGWFEIAQYESKKFINNANIV